MRNGTAMLALLLLTAFDVFAKGPTVRIVVKGTDLRTPLEIVEPAIVEKFNVWSGLGVTINGEPQLKDSFADWAAGPVREKPAGMRRFEVSFFVRIRCIQDCRPPGDLAYVVTYEYDPAAGKGYIYLPGKGEEWYGLNVSSIFRRAEGSWFAASPEWDVAVRPLIDAAVAPANPR